MPTENKKLSLPTLLKLKQACLFLFMLFNFRLPIVQGGSAAFYPPLLAIFRTFDKCPLVLSEGELKNTHSIKTSLDGNKHFV